MAEKKSVTAKREWFDMSLDEVAQELGVSRQRVGQIELKALARVKKGLAARGYGEEDCCDGSSQKENGWYWL